LQDQGRFRGVIRAQTQILYGAHIAADFFCLRLVDPQDAYHLFLYYFTFSHENPPCEAPAIHRSFLLPETRRLAPPLH